MIELKRFTTQYDPAEDRVRLTGSDDEGRTVVLWLTQRLLNRLAPRLCQGLEGRAVRPGAKGRESPLHRDVEQSFAQQKARSALTVQPPVVPLSDAPHWLVGAVDVEHSRGAARLTFKGVADVKHAVLNLTTSALRQWLAIVYEQYRRAGWAIQAWPAWMEEGAGSPVRPKTVALH